MHEMRVEVGVEESSKMKLVRSTWAGQMADKNGKETRCTECGWEMDARKIEIGLDWVESELEKWEKNVNNDRRNWRLLTDKLVREK